jgi:hypothetical protein
MQATNTPAIPIHALLADDLGPNLAPDSRPLLLSADLVFGRDVTSGREFLVYGRPFLERIVRTGRSRPARVVRIELDQNTDELEVLCTVIEALRGRCDYKGGAD